jgi:hypothetical protein
LFNALTRWKRTRDERAIFIHELDMRAWRLSRGLGDYANRGLYPAINLPWRPSRDRPKTKRTRSPPVFSPVSPARRRALDPPAPP